MLKSTGKCASLTVGPPQSTTVKALGGNHSSSQFVNEYNFTRTVNNFTCTVKLKGAPVNPSRLTGCNAVKDAPSSQLTAAPAVNHSQGTRWFHPSSWFVKVKAPVSFFEQSTPSTAVNPQSRIFAASGCLQIHSQKNFLTAVNPPKSGTARYCSLQG